MVQQSILDHCRDFVWVTETIHPNVSVAPTSSHVYRTNRLVACRTHSPHRLGHISFIQHWLSTNKSGFRLYHMKNHCLYRQIKLNDVVPVSSQGHLAYFIYHMESH